MRILRENCTGLVIDIQEKLMPVMANKENLITNCIKLIEGLQLLTTWLNYKHYITRRLGCCVAH